jgi:DNA-binding beta-propeller fold protein YncE
VSRRLRSLVALAALCAHAACTPACEESERRSLVPYPNPFAADHPLYAPQPPREKPLEIVVSEDAATAWVSLQGTEDEPGRHVVAVDVASGEVVAKIEVGSSPTGLALHPGGRFLVVLNRFSNFASVIDTAAAEVVTEVPAEFYSVEAVFSPSGDELWLTNRWRDAVAVWDVSILEERFVVTASETAAVEVGANPRDIAISEDGATVAVAALTGNSVSLIDVATRSERARVDLGAPANDVVIAGGRVIVATTSRSTHHQPFAGPDTDGDGQPGDGTPNINFQDLQNELAVLDADSGAIVGRYTSDSICCRDYRDVDPRDDARYGDLLPAADTWIVGGALPEQLALTANDEGGQRVWVTYSGSDEVQAFDLDAGGGLVPGPLWGTAGHNPHGVAVAGDKLLVAHRLSETLGVYDVASGELVAAPVVGDVSGGAFPATDAEIGELFNFVTAPFTVDGDQTCQHCHREGGNIDKAFSMPLTRYAGLGLRQTMAYRGMADSQPWFFEAAMDHTNFVPVMNEFARIENFCCSDYTLWSGGAPAGCASNPPPECTGERNAGSRDGATATRSADDPYAHPRPTAAPTRDRFYLDAIERLIGRTESFGDGLYFEDPVTRERRPLPLNFDGITRALGLFLLQDTRLLPNPHDRERSSVERGQAIFESAETGCVACHPAPTFSLAVSRGADTPVVMGPVVTPLRADDGTNLDLFASGFVDLFADATMDSCEEVCGEQVCTDEPTACDDVRQVRFGVTPLRGIWDRAPSMLHHGLAKGLREVLATPGHPALRDGERGFNERDGVPDSHGGTSHLSARDLQDLIDYLETL